MPGQPPHPQAPGTASVIQVRPATPADITVLGRLGGLLVALHHQFDADRFIAPTPGTALAYGSFLGGETRSART